MLLFLFTLGRADPVYYRNCTRDENRKIIECHEQEWETVNSALIPCNLLAREFRICTSVGLNKFQAEFPDIELPSNGCDKEYNKDLNAFGIGICQPVKGAVCLGEKLWIVNDHRCFIDGDVSYITAFITSLFFGIFGVDRFYLGYAFLGTLKLLTLGGFGIMYLVDLIRIAIGSLQPALSTYKIGY